jgi:hypothetical protein
VAGTFGINDQAVWMPNSGSYDGALERIAEQLASSDAALAEQLRDAQLDSDQAIFLDDLAPDRFKTFEAATVAAFEETVAAGAAAPRDYGWFLTMFSALKALARMDPRASGTANTDVRIVLDGQPVWSGPRWLAESLLEHLASDLWRNGFQELGQRLYDERGSTWTGVLDLSYLLRLSDEDAAALSQAVQFLTPRFAKVFETNAPEYLPRMHAALTALGEGLQRTRTRA